MTALAVSKLALAPLPQFDPLQLVRLWIRQAGTSRGLRFKANLDATFPGRPIAQATVEPMEEGREGCLQITTADFCVASALGPLPEPFVAWLRELQADGRNAMGDFLDLFNQRLHLLRHGMRSQFEPGLNNAWPEHTELAKSVAALMGLFEAGRPAQLGVPTRSWLGIGSLRSGVRRSAAALRQVLAAHLGCPVEVEQLVGAWQPIAQPDQQRLGQRRLGQSALLGSRVWVQLSRVRVRIGPLPLQQALRLAPAAQGATGTSSLHSVLAELAELMLDSRFEAEVNIAVLPETVPASQLSTRSGGTLLLGTCAWLQRRSEIAPRSLQFVLNRPGQRMSQEAA